MQKYTCRLVVANVGEKIGKSNKCSPLFDKHQPPNAAYSGWSPCCKQLLSFSYKITALKGKEHLNY